MSISRAVVPLAPSSDASSSSTDSSLRLAREHARVLQLDDERVEIDARAARDVGGRGEEPERREPEREDRAELDDVPGALAHEELLRRGLDLARDLVLRPLDAADELDGDAEEVLRGRLVQPRATHESRQEQLGGLVDRPARSCAERAKQALRERDDEPGGAVHSLAGAASGSAAFDRDAAEERHALELQRRRVRVSVSGRRRRRRLRRAPSRPSRRASRPGPSPRSRRRRCARSGGRPGASSASRRSTAMPPNHENIEPPRNACARLLSSMPSKIATSATSSRRLVTARGQRALGEGRGRRHARPGAELEEHE